MPDNTPISKREPHFTELLMLYDKHKYRKTKANIFSLWEKMIRPDVPKINKTQFINYTRNLKEKERDKLLQAETKKPIEQWKERRESSLIELESKIKSAAGNLLEEANQIMEIADGAELKERYFALTVVDRMWAKTQKEKEISIKAHAEKRESVGMFSKLLRGAMSGEFTMRDVAMMKETYGNIDKTTARIEGAPEGAAE